jgi:hypothetical protein
MSMFVLFSFLHPKEVGVKHQSTNQPKGNQNPVNQRRTGNAIVKRKKDNGTNYHVQLTTHKTKDRTA